MAGHYGVRVIDLNYAKSKDIVFKNGVRVAKECFETDFFILMDSAYDAPQIRSYSAELGHVPIIDTNPRQEDEERDGSASGAFQESQHSRAGQLEFEGQLWWKVRAGARSSQSDDASDDL